MDDKDLQLYKKFKDLISSGIDEKAAEKLFFELSTDDCNRLIEVFTNNDFSDIQNQTKQKVIIILKKLRDRVRESD